MSLTETSPISHIQIEAARVLVHFISAGEDMRRQVLVAGGIRAFLKLLQRAEHETLRTEALRALDMLLELPGAVAHLQESDKQDLEEILSKLPVAANSEISSRAGSILKHIRGDNAAAD